MGRVKEMLLDEEYEEPIEDIKNSKEKHNYTNESITKNNYKKSTDILTEYNQVSERINEIRKNRKYYASKLKFAVNEDDIIEYKYQMMKLNEELTPLLSKQKILEYDLKIEKQKKERAIRKLKEQKEFEAECKHQKEKIYKRLYVSLNEKQLNLIKKIFRIKQDSREQIFNEMFNNHSIAVIIIITSLFEVVSFSEVEHIANNIEKYDEDYWRIISKYQNNEIIFNKLCNLPDIKMVEKNADVKVVEFEEAYPLFSFIYEDDYEYYDGIMDDVNDMFSEYNYFFRE